jgi:predicted PurR-regulated permease PerM
MIIQPRPPAWLPRAAATVAAVILGVLAALWVADRLRTLLFIIFIALFVAVALEPAVQYLANRGWKRTRATGVVFLLTLLALASFIAALVPVFVSQASSLVENMPAYIEDVQGWIDRQPNLDIDIFSDQLAAQFESLGTLITSYGATVAGGVFAVGNTVFSAIFRFVTVSLFAFYMVAEGPKMRRTLLSTMPPNRQREALRIWEISVEKTGGYIYSRLVLAIVAASFTALMLSLLGVPYAIALGLWVGVLSQFVPVIGTYIAAVLPVLVALVPEGPNDVWHGGRALWVLVALIGYQQVLDLLVAPKITAKAMAIHPAVSVAALIAGANLLGGMGAVLALPAAAIIQAVISTAWERHELIDSEALVEPPVRPPRRRSKAEEASTDGAPGAVETTGSNDGSGYL